VISLGSPRQASLSWHTTYAHPHCRLSCPFDTSRNSSPQRTAAMVARSSDASGRPWQQRPAVWQLGVGCLFSGPCHHPTSSSSLRRWRHVTSPLPPLCSHSRVMLQAQPSRAVPIMIHIMIHMPNNLLGHSHSPSRAQGVPSMWARVHPMRLALSTDSRAVLTRSGRSFSSVLHVQLPRVRLRTRATALQMARWHQPSRPPLRVMMQVLQVLRQWYRLRLKKSSSPPTPWPIMWTCWHLACALSCSLPLPLLDPASARPA